MSDDSYTVYQGKGCVLPNGATVDVFPLSDGGAILEFGIEGRKSIIRLSSLAMAAVIRLWVEICTEPHNTPANKPQPVEGWTVVPPNGDPA